VGKIDVCVLIAIFNDYFCCNGHCYIGLAWMFFLS
jgi:hypothetical protein